MKKTNKGLKVFWYPYSIYLYPKAHKKSNFAGILEIDQIGFVTPLDHCAMYGLKLLKELILRKKAAAIGAKIKQIQNEFYQTWKMLCKKWCYIWVA